MNEYHKIHTIFKRDEKGKLIFGDFSRPEFEYLQHNDWEWTEKVDGTNIRVMWKDGMVKFGGKTDRASIPSKLMNNLIEMFPEHKFMNLEHNIDEMCLYGEGYGAGIQKGGGNYSKIQTFVLFDVKIGHWWLLREAVKGIARHFDIQTVPVIQRPLGKGSLWNAIDYVGSKEGFKSHWGDFQAEGLVLRPLVPLHARNGDRVIAKIKHRDFE
jgi:hypothetical protein